MSPVCVGGLFTSTLYDSLALSLCDFLVRPDTWRVCVSVLFTQERLFLCSQRLYSLLKGIGCMKE